VRSRTDASSVFPPTHPLPLSGALSAWARLRLPHIIHTALSTSSPVQADFDFTGYNYVVGQSLGKASIGGSAACVASTTAAFAAIDAAFAGSAAERHAMATKLSSCTPLDGTNDTMWAATNYASYVMGLVQCERSGSRVAGWQVQVSHSPLVSPSPALPFPSLRPQTTLMEGAMMCAATAQT
jgi:hypothetical protein